jgi:hypothetical protein
MVDAEDLVLVEIFVDEVVEGFGAGEVGAEGFFDDQTLEPRGRIEFGVHRALAQAGDDRLEGVGGRGEVEEAIFLGVSVLFVELSEQFRELLMGFGGAIIGALEVV